MLLDEGKDIDLWDGYREEHGSLTDLNGRLLAIPQQKVSRRVEIFIEEQTLPGFTSIQGRRVVVEAFDNEDRLLGSISEWVAHEDTEP